MFDEKTFQKLNHYVYLLIDPKTDEPFYVGKGVKNRVFAHVNCALDTETENDKYDEIRRIQNEGNQVKHVIVRHGLSNETALEIESSLIDTFKFIPQFSKFIKGNIQGGVASIERGFMSTDEIKRLYNAAELNEIGDDCIIININQTYRRGLGEDAIYKATKETWKIGSKRIPKIKYVLSEYHGLIVRVFEVKEWYRKERPYGPNAKKAGQLYFGFGFNGILANEEILNLYINKSIALKKKTGIANVIRYTLSSPSFNQ